MSQFGVYRNRNPKTRKIFPYLLDIQCDLLEQIHTTVVVPLGKYSTVKDQVITKLCPIVEIDGIEYAALTQQLAGIDRRLLGVDVTNISNCVSDIIAAVDLILSGI